jgi:hypothetical protein
VTALDPPDARAGTERPTVAVRGLARAVRRAGRPGGGEIAALVVLVVLPVLVFGVPAALGHPVVPGDDLIQNEPLRALVGRQVRHGHLPVLDPYIWSGAPLLGGWNAGAAYPPTLLFAFLPVTLAWALNQVLVGWVAGLGTHVFLRHSELRTVPAFLGALTFSLGGAMVGQVPHFGLVAGMSWTPLMLLALLHLSRPAPLPARLGWSAVLATGAGLCVLAGEPRAIDTALVVVAWYILWRAVHLGRRSGPFLVWVGAAALAGIALGALQWLPGVATVHASQRSAVTYNLFNAGSLPPRWLLLLLVPSVLGGSGSFGTPPFLASYNLTEVTGYVGLVPLAAAFALATRLRWRRPLPEWAIWLVVAATGIVLALGGNTPAWHLLIHLPLYGGQRLQSRNILVADFALAVLLAYWLDGWLATEARPAERIRAALRGAVPALVPLVGAAVTVVLGLAWGPAFLRWLGVAGRPAAEAPKLAPVLVPFLVLAVLAAALVALGRRLRPGRRAALVVGFVTLDLLALASTSVVEVAGNLGARPGPANALTSLPTAPGRTRSIASLHLPGRFAVFDPGLLHGEALNELGVPDLNVLDRTYSMQGYSSIVDGTYAAATGAHQPSGAGQDVLSVAAVADGTLDQLETSTLFTLPRYLVRVAAWGEPSATGAGTDVGVEQVDAGSTRTWYFGEPLEVASIEVATGPVPGRAGGVASFRVGLVGATGSVTWLTPRGTPDRRLVSGPDRPRPAVGVVVAASPGTGALAVRPPQVTEPNGQVVIADGPLQAALVPPHWTYVGDNGPFAVFRDHRARPAVVVRPMAGSTAGSTAGRATMENGAGTVRVLDGPSVAPSRLLVSSPAGVELVRSVAAIAGWKATWAPNGGGPSRELAIRRSGVVQAVDVPAGRGVLTFAYEPTGVGAGLVLSVGATAVLLAGFVAAWLLAARRRSARAQVPPSSA